MFSEVDNTIFPDSCEVIQIASQHFVYPIFKCGRSSLHQSMEYMGWRWMTHNEIQKISSPIQVFVRDPKQRFVSGVNTYVQHLKEENQNIDIDTALYFVNRYLFLNRHYAPQFFWLLNLARFIGVHGQVTLCDVSEISKLTPRHSHAEVDPITNELLQKIEQYDWSKLDLYLYLDQALLDHVGNTVEICDLIQHVKLQPNGLYDLVFDNSLDIANVLSQA